MLREHDVICVHDVGSPLRDALAVWFVWTMREVDQYQPITRLGDSRSRVPDDVVEDVCPGEDVTQ